MTSIADISLTNWQTLLDALARLGLTAPGEPIQVQELTGGVSSTILKVETPRKKFCIKQALPSLKVAGAWNAPVERVYAEIAWLRVAEQVVPNSVPHVLGVDHATGSFAMSFLPPDHFLNWKSELMAGRVDASFAAQVATALVSIHKATAHQQEIKTGFANDENFFALRLDPYLMEAAKHHPDLASRLHELVHRTQTTKLALVHGDISPKNILAGPSGPVFLDAECAWYGDPAFDVAFCLNHLLLKSAAKRDVSQALLSLFDDFTETYITRVDWEPKPEIEQRIATLLPALALARISGKSKIEYLDPAASQTVVDTARELLLHPVTEIRAVEEAWKKGFGF